MVRQNLVNLREVPLTSEQLGKFQKRNQLLTGLHKSKFQQLEKVSPKTSPVGALSSKYYGNVQARVKSYVYPDKGRNFKIEKDLEEEMIKAELEVGGGNPKEQYHHIQNAIKVTEDEDNKRAAKNSMKGQTGGDGGKAGYQHGPVQRVYEKMDAIR